MHPLQAHVFPTDTPRQHCPKMHELQLGTALVTACVCVCVRMQCLNGHWVAGMLDHHSMLALTLIGKLPIEPDMHTLTCILLV